MKTSWNLKLLYKSDSDPQIKKDLKKIANLCSEFEKKYKGKAFTASPQILAKAMADYDAMRPVLDGMKPWWYFSLKGDLNSEDSNSNALATRYEQAITEAMNKITFFYLEIAKISLKKQKIFLNHSSLTPYRYILKKIFRRAKFNLSEGEEKLEGLLNQTSYSMWIESQQKLLNQQVIEHKGKNIPIVQAMGELANLPTKERREVHKKVVTVLKNISFMAESEFNAIYNYKKVMDKLRGYGKPYSATVLGYENDEKSIESLVSLVTKNFKISHRFYALHAKLLKEKKITLADRETKIGVIKKKFDFKTSVSILQSVLGKIDPEYLNIFNTFLTKGQIDVYPKKGKKGGAYCWGMGGLSTFVLLNHMNDVRSLETLAHEMGHAIHTEMSKKQPTRYRKYSTATAEVASTFFEQTIAEEIEKRLSDKEKIILLHNKIKGDISTIFRQIAFFNFELEMHEKIRKQGQISKEGMAEIMAKHLKSYLGNATEVTPLDGYFYVYLSHARRYFYVYTYAYGQIVSRALYEKWIKDPSYAKKIKQFLSAGRSMSPEDIFKMIGIDTSKTSFFETGLKGIEKDIDRLERLAKNANI